MTRLPSLGPRGEGWVLVQSILFVLVAAAGFSVNGAWAREARTVTTIVAGLLVVGGGLLAVSGAVALREAFTPVPRPRDGASLVETGAYALVRHPIYGGIVLLAFFRLKSAREEAWLVEAYPGYDAYRVRTKRMIPFLY